MLDKGWRPKTLAYSIGKGIGAPCFYSRLSQAGFFCSPSGVRALAVRLGQPIPERAAPNLRPQRNRCVVRQRVQTAPPVQPSDQSLLSPAEGTAAIKDDRRAHRCPTVTARTITDLAAPGVVPVEDEAQLAALVSAQARPGDLLLMLGAGDIVELTPALMTVLDAPGDRA